MTSKPQTPQARTTKTGTPDPKEMARTKPLAKTPLPDANVDSDGHCILAQDTEGSARPDAGEPCDDGRDGGR